MKTQSLVWLVCIKLAVSLARGAEPPGLVDMVQARPIQIVFLYADFSDLELIISSEAYKVHSPITLQRGRPMEQAEMLKFIERALVEQAGIVITKLDEKRASVTYNDKLPVKPVAEAKPLILPGGNPPPLKLSPPTNLMTREEVIELVSKQRQQIQEAHTNRAMKLPDTTPASTNK